jgi:hypothetical protein
MPDETKRGKWDMSVPGKYDHVCPGPDCGRSIKWAVELCFDCTKRARALAAGGK